MRHHGHTPVPSKPPRDTDEDLWDDNDWND